MSDQDPKDDGSGALAMSIMETQLMSQGIGTIRMKDGQAFLFSEYTLEKLLEAARKNPEKKAFVFIKSGPDVSKAVV